MKFDCSVIIPVYNASALIRRCIDSILAQKGNYSYEVLLVDDGSTDDSVAIIESYKNPCFMVFRQKNAGTSVARNKWVKETDRSQVFIGDSMVANWDVDASFPNRQTENWGTASG